MAAATVHRAPRRAVLADQPGHLGPRQSRRLRQVLANRPLAGPAQPRVANAHQGAPDKFVGVVSVLWEIVDRLAAIQEGPDLIDRANAFGLKCHDHAPMIAQTGSSGSCSIGQGWFLPLHRGKSTIIPARGCTNSPCRNRSQTSFDRAGLKFWRELVKWGPQRVPVGERLVGEGNLKTGFPPRLIITSFVFEKTAVTRLRELWRVRRCVSVPDSRREAAESLDKKIREDFV